MPNIAVALTEQKAAQKQNRHIAVALNHLTTLRAKRLAQEAALRKEIDELDTAILALNPE